MKYEENFKKEVVKKVLSPGVVTREVCRKLKVSETSVRTWRIQYKEELSPEIERIWEEHELKEKNRKEEEEKVDIEKLLLEAVKEEYKEDHEENLPDLGEVLSCKKSIEKYTIKEKYVIVTKVRSLKENEEGFFLRRNGFKKQQIIIWENELLAMSKKKIKNDEYIRSLEEENKKLRKNLKNVEREKEELKVLIELKKKYPSLFKDEKDS